MKRSLFFAIISIMGILAISGCDKQKTYDIVFDTNGGTGEMQSQTLTEGESQPLDDNSFVNEGHSFGGWNTLPDGSGVSYSDGQDITLTSDITLYAQWTSNDTESAPDSQQTTGSLNGYEWVDLGLPSGTRWASRNIGAKDPESYGDYYAWGEVTTKEIYYWHTYQHSRGDAYCSITKYCPLGINGFGYTYGYAGYTDNRTILEPCDDAATVNWGEGWRMPTKEEMEELLNNCTNVWTSINGVNGRKFIGSNGNSIFLPAAGNYYDVLLLEDDADGYYWSSSVYSDNANYSWIIKFDSSNCLVNHQHYRYRGHPVRPVLAQ